MKTIHKILFIFMLFIFNGCSYSTITSSFTSIFPHDWFHSEPQYIMKARQDYIKFKKETNLRKSFKTYEDKKILQDSNASNTRVTVDISEQRVRLYVANIVAIDAPCTTGAKEKFEPNTKIYRDKRTPKGIFPIIGKLRDKRSSIFGKYYCKDGSCVYTGDKRKFKGSKEGLRYEGASLKNWMRLTGGGIGLHSSKYIKRNPGTNGCIRLPHDVSKILFKHVSKGTKVTIQN